VAGSNVTSIALDCSGAAVGDVMWAIVGISDTQTSLSAPTGWTLYNQVDQTRAHTAVFWRVKQSGDTSVTVSWTTTARVQGLCVSWPGVDTTTPGDGWGTYTRPSAGTTYPVTVTAGTGRHAVMFSTTRGTIASNTWTPDSALTELLDVGNTATAYFSVQLAAGTASAGSNTYTSTASTSNSNGAAAVFYLVPASGGVTVSPSGLATAEAFGTAAVSATLTASPSGIATAGAFGTATVSTTLTCSPAGLASGEAFGTAAVSATLTASPSGIATAESFGTAAVSATLTASPTGIASGEAFGAAVVTGGNTGYNLFPIAAPQLTGFEPGSSIVLGTEFYVTSACWVTQVRYLASTNQEQNTRVMSLWSTADGTTGTMVAGPFSMPTHTPGDWVTYTLPTPFRLTANLRYRIATRHPEGSYAATGAYFHDGAGQTTLTQGPVIRPSEADALGNGQGSYDYGTTDFFPSSHFNGGAYYSDVTITDVDPNPATTVSPAGISSGETFGTAGVSATLAVSPGGIASGEAFGGAALSASLTASPAGIASGEAFGTATVAASLTASPSGVPSAEAFGALSVSAALQVTATGILPAEAFGTAVIGSSGSPTSISPAGIGSAEAFGELTISTALELDPAGLATGELFGTPAVAGILTVTPTGIPPAAAFGTPTLTLLPPVVSPAGIASGTVFGHATISGALTGHLVAAGSLPARRYHASITLKRWEGSNG
jgi:hypothetical protein